MSDSARRSGRLGVAARMLNGSVAKAASIAVSR
jgi:hypothetical protein